MRILILSLVVLIYCVFIFADGVQPIGLGTETEPYQVETLDNLLWISTNNSSWNSHFIQTDDIYAADTENWNEGEGFLPIGNIDVNFTGSYNGQSFSITGLYIDRNEAANQGLFGRVTNSIVENLILTDFFIAGQFNASGLIAHAYYSTISNCYTQGSASGTTHVSGLIGIGEGCTISYCSTYASVIGEEFIGGVIGQCYQSTADNCSSYGYVEGIGNLGGWAGIIFDSQITNCFSQSDIEAFMSAGGFAGTIMNSANIDKCYSTGFIDSGVIDIGGLVGMNIISNVTNSFWDMESSGLTESEGGTGKTTYEMMDVATYTDLSTAGLDDPWDFVGNPYDDIGNNDFWNMDDGYPFLEYEPVVNVDDSVINTPEPIINLSNYPNPFNPETTISCVIPSDSNVELVIYDVKGRKVKSLLNKYLENGEYSQTWNGKDDYNQLASSGLYFCHLKVNSKVQVVNKIVLLK